MALEAEYVRNYPYEPFSPTTPLPDPPQLVGPARPAELAELALCRPGPLLVFLEPHYETND